MAVIALTTWGPTPSVVVEAEKFSLDGEAIRVVNADMSQLEEASRECNASYDLRVGANYREHRDDTTRMLAADGTMRLLPGTAILIETEEWVQFPKKRFGQILPKVSLLQRGMANTPTKIDPGYQGHLIVTVFNHGNGRFPSSEGSGFAHSMCSTLPAKSVHTTKAENKSKDRLRLTIGNRFLI